MAKWLEYELATAALGKIGYPPNQINQNVMNWIKDQEWADCISAGEKAVGALTEVLNSPDSIVRRCAAGALGQIGAAPDLSNPTLLVPAVGRLIEHLFDEAWDVRQGSVWALGQIGNPAAAFGLSFVMHNDTNEAVRQDAANSIHSSANSYHAFDPASRRAGGVFLSASLPTGPTYLTVQSGVNLAGHCRR